ncbi:MAG TPA: LLM class flavin-dependent oxidoreductase [Candidatus Limnocylindria bacterium]|jgi:alkanesulfonate monooxygenase SsuD/methylene tetrahydromethanopterin reductase-like flavin-dependent oxidoreductase (luciferase family)
MRIGFKTSQTNVDWPTLRATWELGDELTVFDSGWIFDHFVALGDDGGGSHEGMILAGALAVLTKRLQFGHLVLGNTYRHPALVANMGATLDHLALGRFVLGLGAGWHETEHAMYGMRLPPIGERISMLESAVRVIKALWQQPGGVTLDAQPYALHDAVCDPAPVTPGGPPIWLGTQGLRRGLRIVAQYADGWNQTGDPATFPEKRDALLRHCEAVGRDPAEIEISAQAFLRDGDHEATLRTAATFVEQGADHVILIMPAANGPDGLRQLAERVAEPLRARFG